MEKQKEHTQNKERNKTERTQSKTRKQQKQNRTNTHEQHTYKKVVSDNTINEWSGRTTSMNPGCRIPPP